MSNDELDRSLGFLVHDVSRLFRKSFDRRARSLGLTRSQWRVLAHLWRREGINQAGLAEILEIEPITLARLLDRLGKAGWVERRADPGDRRVRLVYLTAKARPLLDRLRAVAADVREQALGGLRDGERERLIDRLLAVKANLLADNGAARRENRGAVEEITERHGAVC